ncbi:uncharacterized protein N7483_010371 [Penicillium malachiteum]|uniref:uncharacterized protein n=1 Tax=Penicillium malachiteum TaxID=1324776 RepID=UPI002548E870|nr:uncharacterized protein N7483_010371 [Penicillium malachiteum]KAJ5713190.1 hypothetical protein N7483_010371 [Penicillium malachiteum]
MPSFRDFFKSKPRSKSAPPASRHAWSRLRRSQAAEVPLTHGPQPTPEDEDAHSMQGGQDGAGDSETLHGTDEQGNDDDGSPLERQVSTTPQRSHQSHAGSDQSQSQNGSQRESQRESQGGSKRFKGFMARFRLSRTQDRSSASEVLQPSIPIPQDGAQDSVTTDPVKRASSPQQPLAGEQEAETHEQNRNVSAQTAQSQDSNITVCRHPSQRVPMAVHELQEDVFWSSLLNFEKDPSPTPITSSPTAPSPPVEPSHPVGPSHPVEPSDPFSDGKNIEPQHHQAMPSSNYSGDHSQRQSEASAHSKVQGEPLSKSVKSRSIHIASDSGISTTRASSASSHGSRASRLSRVDPSKAAAAFDALATKMGISLSLREDETPVTVVQPAEDESDNQARRRHRFGRVRPTQSHSTLAPTHSPAKLRRTKTFASLAHRSSPMSSLRGRSIEDIARLGGHSFLILPYYLAPVALQLPACIVAMVMYLRKGFSGAPPYPHVFEDPGDIRAATRLYNHFASQVLLPERDAHRIAMTMRVVAMPPLDTESNSAAILSVGWVFMQILGGLPNGILGSVRLFRVLHVISLRGPNPDSNHIRLITLAIMGLTSEMQCSLICGVLGFFYLLLQRTESAQESTNQNSGNPVRPVANCMPLQLGRLARVFAPLLIGRRAVKRSVEEEIEEERVMEFLLAHWPKICRQLWDWTASSRNKREQDEC